MPVIELRQYQLVPGKRDELIDLFEAELVEPQERCGIEIIGTFRDLDDANLFVWIRGFPDMERRAISLRDFYGGSVWRRHRAAANATMIDSDNVLLLRPAFGESGVSAVSEPSAPSTGRGMVHVGIVMSPGPVSEAVQTYLRDEISPHVELAGATLLAWLTSEPAENTFPALPVREGENVLVWIAGFPDPASHAAAPRLRAQLEQAAQAWPVGPVQIELHHLAPTPRSRLTGSPTTARAPLRLRQAS